MSGNGGSTKKPFDLDAAAAARREAEGDGFVFTFKGTMFDCLPAKEWPVAISGMLTGNDLVGALTAILGSEQGELFLAGNPTMGDVETLMTQIAQHSGVDDLGE
jgi:hypothetical protein